MSSSREQLRLHDIIENIDLIHEYMGERTFDELYADRMRVDAIERCLQRITEAAIKIGPTRMMEIIPALPASKVRGLGNVLRHHYDTLDAQTVLGHDRRSPAAASRGLRCCTGRELSTAA